MMDSFSTTVIWLLYYWPYALGAVLLLLVVVWSVIFFFGRE